MEEHEGKTEGTDAEPVRSNGQLDGWVSCSDRLPPERELVIVQDENKAGDVPRRGFDLSWRYGGQWVSWYVIPTRWRKLPE